MLPMHSAVNVGRAGDPAIFFGLSGTGKTTLSADPERSLIGDDEHGWGSNGVFNFEGGCYAKTIRLSPMYEPDIFATTRRFGTILENVDIDPATRELDLDSERFTENTRAAYPLEFIGNADPTGIAGQPRNVILLTADAFGVLPPIARLTPRPGGLPLPVAATRPSWPGPRSGSRSRRRPSRPASGRRSCPAAGRVRRHARRAPRAVRRAGLAGQHRLDRRAVRDRRADEHRPHPGDGPGGAQRPPRERRHGRRPALRRRGADRAARTCPPASSQPRATWADPDAYDQAAANLARMFAANFEAYAEQVAPAIRAAGPRVEP